MARSTVALLQNLLTRSSQQEHADWAVKTNISVTANAATDPFGGSGARAVVESTSTNVLHQLAQSNTGWTAEKYYTFSVYVKAGARNYVALNHNAADPAMVVCFDLTTGNGLIGATAAQDVFRKFGTYGSVYCGNGWWRLWISRKYTSGSGAYPGIIQTQNIATGYANNTYTGVAGTTAIYVFGAQISEGNGLVPYVETIASTINQGPPRVLAGGGAPSQNLITQSEDLTATGWIDDATGTTRTAAYALDPFGLTMTASRVVFPAGGTRFAYNFASGSGIAVVPGPLTISMWVRATTGTATLRLRLQSNLGVTNDTSSDFSFDTTWRRISFSTTVLNPGAGLLNAAFLLANSVAAASDFLVWGVQMEQDIAAGSYIKTTTAQIQGPHRITAPIVQNLLLQSEALATSPWNANGGTVIANNTADVPDPRGGSTASKITYTTGGALYRFYQANAVTGVATWSIWLRTLSGTVVARLADNAGGVSADITITTTWQRFSFTATNPAGGYSFAVIGPTAGDPSVVFYAWGGQVNRGVSAAPYVKTTTTAIDIGGAPRFLVPSSQNLLLVSEDFTNANWTKEGTVTTTPDVVVAPDGTLTADQVDNVSNTQGIYQRFSSVAISGKVVTRSIWLRSVSGTVALDLRGPDGGEPVQACVLTTTWQRFQVTGSNPSTSLNRVGLYLAGTNVGAAGSFYAWGGQVEQSNWAGQYAKTVAAIVDSGPPRSLA